MSEEIKKKKKRKKKRKKVVKQKTIKMPEFRMPSLPRIDFGVGTFKKMIIIIAVLMVFACGIAVFIEKYTVDTIIVEGSSHYTTEEINEMVLGDGFLAKNSVVLSLRYRNKEIKDVPFVETMSVRIMSPTSIRITVYEKAVAGYVEYMGQYIYFDKDGTVIESSQVRTEGVPQIVGMEFDHVVLHEKLPVSDDKIFREILDVSQKVMKL